MSEPLDVYVCVGSSCHVHGSERVIEQIQALIAERGLAERVTLKGSFCLEHCSMGVSVRVGEKVLAGVQPESAAATVWPEIEAQLTARAAAVGRHFDS